MHPESPEKNMNTLSEPTSAEQALEVEFGNDIVARLIDSTILSFGANDRGEIYISSVKNGEITELIIGKDEQDEVCIFEVENGEGGEL